MRLQSAMEYLMTYGWAILIIAVVLGAIYSLGLFNGTSLAPRSQPGSCQVLRPNGALTTQYISLAGTCTNELPQYVAQFNGAGSYIATGTAGLPVGSTARSMFSWIYLTGNSLPTSYDVQAYGTQDIGKQSFLTVFQDVAYFAGDGNDFQTTMAISLNTWHFVGYSYAAGATTVTVYVDGQSQTGSLSGGTALNTLLGTSTIGSQVSLLNWFKGSIADVQIYNTSLDANSVKALYQEGIGGTPINLQNLVAWWPLNGNANDYSGNINNGVPTSGVTYTSQWIPGYTVP